MNHREMTSMRSPVQIHSTRRLSLAIAMFVGLLGVPGVSVMPSLDARPANAQPAAKVKSASDVKTLLNAALPANAKEIAEAMTSAKAGETITIRGNVALAKDAFADKVAVFTLVDESTREGKQPAPDALPDTSSDVPSRGRATVQIVDAGGKPLPFGLRGEHGLKPGAEVFVTGTVHAANGADSLVLNISSMHIPKGQLPATLFAAKTPENARDISEARKAGTMKVGDEVVLRGRVGGSKEPFVAGRAVFTLMGRGLKACNENPDDKCSKPWDYCCDTKQEILANSVTVQVVDAKSQIIRTDMKGRRGMKELSEIVIVGTVVVADGKAVVVNATSMHVAH